MLQYACLQYLGFPSVESQRQTRGDDLNAEIIYLELWMLHSVWLWLQTSGGIHKCFRVLLSSEQAPRMLSPDLHYWTFLLAVSQKAPHCNKVFPGSDLPKPSQNLGQKPAKFSADILVPYLKKKNHEMGRMGLDQTLVKYGGKTVCR